MFLLKNINYLKFKYSRQFRIRFQQLCNLQPKRKTSDDVLHVARTTYEKEDILFEYFRFYDQQMGDSSFGPERLFWRTTLKVLISEQHKFRTNVDVSCKLIFSLIRFFSYFGKYCLENESNIISRKFGNFQ